MRIGGVLILSAWQLREVARRFYPGNPSLQRKWIRAWRLAPGPRCAIGTRCTQQDQLESDRKRAIAYLRQGRAPVEAPDNRLRTAYR